MHKTNISPKLKVMKLSTSCGHSNYSVEGDGMWKNLSSEFVPADGHLHRCTLDLEFHKYLRTMIAAPQRAYHLLWFFVQLRQISRMAPPFLCGFALGMCILPPSSIGLAISSS